MTLELPVGYANTRYIWQVQGIVDAMGFSIATFNHGLSSASDIAGQMSNAWAGGTIGTPAQWNDEFLYVGTQTTLMTGSGPIVANFFENTAGTNSGDACPVNCSVLVSKVTTSGGRKNRGRFNIPSGKVEEAGISAAGFITPTTVTSLQNQVDEYFTDLLATTFTPVVLHSDPADTPTEIVGLLVSSQISTQRRRMR